MLISHALADEADKPKLGKVFYPDAIRFVSNTSDDREAATIMFDNFVLATSNGKGELLESRTKSFSVANKIEGKDAVSVALDIRGFVSVQEGGSAVIIVQAGGETTLVDLSKAIEAAKAEAGYGEALHASDYSEYAYLQMRNDSAAMSIIGTLPTLMKNFDPNAIVGAANGVAGYFALAAIPARYALERRNWTDAEALVPLTTAYPFTEAMTYFANALGASLNGHLAPARAAMAWKPA